MAIDFNEIPATLRLPGVFMEFDPRLAGRNNIDFKIMVFGQRLTAGTVSALTPTRIINNKEEIDTFFGRGSQLAEMLKSLKSAWPWIETWAMPLDDDGAGVQASGDIKFVGPATAAGTIYLYIAGKQLRIAVASGDTADNIATAVAAKINEDGANSDLPVTAAVDGVDTAKVNITCRWKGETGNDIDIRLGYYDEDLPAGITLSAITAMAGGTSNPDITAAIAALGDEWWNYLVMPYTDTSNLVLLETELDRRWGPMVQKGARTFTAYADNLANTGTFGNGRNNPHVTCMGINTSPTPPYIWAAVNCVMAAKRLINNPARALLGIKLPGILPPKLEDRWDDSDRNTLLWDGISTFKVQHDGSVLIENQITMYQKNSMNINDDAFLLINTPETLERWRFHLVARLATHYLTSGFSLADDDYEPSPGQKVARPKDINLTVLATYREGMVMGWLQDYDGYKLALHSEIDAQNPARVNIYESPKLIGPLLTIGILSEFRR